MKAKQLGIRLMIESRLLKSFHMEYRYDERNGEHVFGEIDTYYEDNVFYGRLQELMGEPVDIYIERVNKLVKNVIINHITLTNQNSACDHLLLSFNFIVTGLEHYDPMLENMEL